MATFPALKAAELVTTQVVEDTANRFYRVAPIPNGPDHVWFGVQVKQTRNGFVDRANAKVELVRKLGCRNLT